METQKKRNLKLSIEKPNLITEFLNSSEKPKANIPEILPNPLIAELPYNKKLPANVELPKLSRNKLGRPVFEQPENADFITEDPNLREYNFKYEVNNKF